MYALWSIKAKSSVGTTIKVMMFHLFLVVLMHLVKADLLGYNRGVNTSYQHVKTVMQSAVTNTVFMFSTRENFTFSDLH